MRPSSRATSGSTVRPSALGPSPVSNGSCMSGIAGQHAARHTLTSSAKVQNASSSASVPGRPTVSVTMIPGAVAPTCPRSRRRSRCKRRCELYRSDRNRARKRLSAVTGCPAGPLRRPISRANRCDRASDATGSLTRVSLRFTLGQVRRALRLAPLPARLTEGRPASPIMCKGAAPSPLGHPSG